MDPGSGGKPLRGRGAVSNPAGRFEALREEAFDDGWDARDPPPERVPTEVIIDRTKSIIARNDSPDIPFDRSINPYRGCEHGCIYCFARPSHAYLGFSPGLDFETKIVAKPEAAGLLRRELRKRGYEVGPLALGSNTDPYQPVERDLKITRQLLEVLHEARHPTGIVTKSALILRDLDIIVPMAKEGLAQVMVSVTTLRRDLARAMEPRAAAPARRLATIAALREADVPVGVLASPMIPALNDSELEAILEAAAGAGARSAGFILVRLPHELKELFSEWLETHVPARAAHVESLIRDTRGGQLYEAKFGERMRGQGPYAELLANRFRVASRRYGLDRKHPPFRLDLFRPPRAPGAPRSLFDKVAPSREGSP
ncbi:MAG: PA0069 family radical SAM protein [Acidobacteriota bacterium]|nr:PA0069 family radical SAM protein [Acidobacteriota bacterium]MDE2712241.1 PA0069 family radical SAM protein [Acidobacteriota bacterium]MXX85525.1 PA0069 family radical SAM protein [Acidobacteriota bacterium]MYF77445.1 PA0069 family radical SAM protein [Acidobacteriota bacterium]MYG76307.1 PA0069 family radical SAM protein [Acidobacteriota bacterium]